MAPRNYKSGIREDAALRTRLAILDAAEYLFARDGFTRTRLPDIAGRAGVALNTVNASVGGKRELVQAVLARYIDHDVIQTALSEIESASSVDELIGRLVAGIRRTYEVTLRPALIIIDAARSEAALEPDYRAMTDTFQTRLQLLAARCVQLSTASARPDPEAVFGVFWFFLGYSAWQVLEELGWKWDERERWIVRQLSTAIADLGTTLTN